MSLALPLTRFLRPASAGLFRRKVALNAKAANAANASLATTEAEPLDVVMPLGLVARGMTVTVASFRNNGRGLEKRLEAMGIRVGSELKVIQQEGGSTVVLVGGTRVALGVAMMHRILVVPQSS